MKKKKTVLIKTLLWNETNVINIFNILQIDLKRKIDVSNIYNFNIYQTKLTLYTKTIFN